MADSNRISVKKLYNNTGQLEEIGIPKNPRFIKDGKFQKLCDSISQHPDFLSDRPIIAYKHKGKLIVICGNMRLRAAKQLGWEDVPCIVKPEDSDAEDLRALSVIDNSNYGEWDMQELANWDIDELEDWGVELPEWDLPSDKDSEQGEEDVSQEENSENDDEDIELPAIQDVLYESDNDFEIPNLLMDMQAGKVELPLTPWGANSRLRKDVATYHFYVDDYRFEKLWKDPVNLLTSGCKAIVEPNCSCHDQTPIAFGLQLIYKKRWLARYCQECGIKVYVDLNVAPKFIEYNKMGVPKGYNAFFTRGLTGFDNALYRDIEVAREISGLQKPNLIVYGGGEGIKKICQKEGLLYIQDFVNAK